MISTPPGLSRVGRQLLRNPDWIDQELAERSLHDFVQQMWSTVDKAPYSDNWHIRLICEHLEAVSRGEIRRLVINIPPRHSKSLTVAVFWPAWTWIDRGERNRPLLGPHVKVLSSSYDQLLSTRDSRKTRDVIGSRLYLQRWGDSFSLRADQNMKMKFENDRGGERIATSVGGRLTGEGGDVILIDDPLNAKHADSEVKRADVIEWWKTTMSTRSNDPRTGAYVLIMQRLHEDDLTGHVLAQETGWTHLCLPARYEHDHPHPTASDPRRVDGALLWPDRYGDAELKKIEQPLGSYGAAGQLQQRPAPREGGMFDKKWWGIVPAAPAGGVVCRGWDLAASEDSTASWTAGVRIRYVNQEFYIEDVERFRGTPEKVERTIKNTASQDRRDVIIDLPQDPGQAGKSQVRYLIKQLPGYNVKYSPESGDKAERAKGMSAQAEPGNVKLVKGAWNHDFIEEAALFPKGTTDQIDAASRAFHRVIAAPKRRRIAGAEAVRRDW